MDATILIWTLFLGFAAGSKRTVSSFRRLYNCFSKKPVVPSSFYDWFSEPLLKLIDDAVRHLGAGDNEGGELGGRLARFKELFLCDASSVKLRDFLHQSFQARHGDERAAAKIHMVYGVLSSTPHMVRVTGERAHEVRRLAIGLWVTGSLLLFDQAYFCYRLFSSIDLFGGWFISRLKCGANPVIVATNDGRHRPTVGMKFLDAVSLFSSRTVDVTVEVKPGGRSRSKQSSRMRVRVVGVRHEVTGEWRFYMTNIPCEWLDPADIAHIYAARWEVELVFKLLKSVYRIDQIVSEKPEVVRIFIHVAIGAMVLGKLLHRHILGKMNAERRRVVFKRMAESLAALGVLLLDDILRACRPSSYRRHKNWEEIFRCESWDPHLNRLLLIENTEIGALS